MLINYFIKSHQIICNCLIILFIVNPEEEQIILIEYTERKSA